MSQFFSMHPDNPQTRLIQAACDIVHAGGVVVYPTDSAYALGCHIGDKKAVERIRRLRNLTDKHNFTLMCRNLSDLGLYAQVDNSTYRQLKAHTPGAYTFVLNATREVPRLLLHPKRRSIGIRVPDNPIVQSLLAQLGAPLLSSTLLLPGDTLPMTDPQHIREHLEHAVDLIIDGGHGSIEPSTVIDLRTTTPQILRQGKGDASAFLND